MRTKTVVTAGPELIQDLGGNCDIEPFHLRSKNANQKRQRWKKKTKNKNCKRSGCVNIDLNSRHRCLIHFCKNDFSYWCWLFVYDFSFKEEKQLRPQFYTEIWTEPQSMSRISAILVTKNNITKKKIILE